MCSRLPRRARRSHVEAEALYAEAARERMKAGKANPSAHVHQGSEKGKAMAQAAKTVGISERSAYDAKKISDPNYFAVIDATTTVKLATPR
jgi:hypothetical protein